MDDKKQTDSVLDSFDYFLEKDKEKVDDLHKSYNDRSYLSSEEVGSEESRTGEYGAAGRTHVAARRRSRIPRSLLQTSSRC